MRKTDPVTQRRRHLEGLRRKQAARVMPTIGPLIDAWCGLPADTFDHTDGSHATFLRAMAALIRAVED